MIENVDLLYHLLGMTQRYIECCIAIFLIPLFLQVFCSIVKILEASWNDIPTERMTILTILNELEKMK